MAKTKCCLTNAPDLRTKRSRGLAPISTMWENGKVLKVKFLEGTRQQQEFVKQVAVQWSAYANIYFEFVEGGDSDIRITFDENDGAWSAVGTDASSASQFRPTMNLGWLDEAVVLHEFGHAIGLGHEHQNPVGGIQWNKPVVYDELSGPPNYWDEDTVDHNLFGRYDSDEIRATELDPASIMMYPIPNEWTLNNFSTDFNPTLSDLDKEFVADIYPKPEDPVVITEPPVITNPVQEDGFKELATSVFSLYDAAIATPGDQHKFSFEVKEEGRYIIETTGNTDMYLTLLGPNDSDLTIQEDDDSGTSRNSKITQDLSPGRYYLKVRHYDEDSGVGPYSISIITARKISVEPGELA